MVSSIAVALLIAAISFAADEYRQVLLVGSLAVPLLAGLLLLRGVNQGLRMIVAAQLPMDVIRWGVALALMGLLVFAGLEASPFRVLTIILLASAVSLGTAAIALSRYLRRLHGSSPPDGSSDRWLGASLSFLAVAVLGIAATEMNTLLLGAISGPRDAGLYQPLAKLAPLMLLAKDAIDMPLAPRIASLWSSGDRAELARVIRKSAVASTAATAVVASAILLASPLIFAAFGSEFEQVRHNLYWVAAAQVVNAGFGPAPVLLAMAGDMRRRIQAQALTLLIQAVLTVALVPKFGVDGAVVALSVQMMAWAAIHWLLVRQTLSIDTSVLGLLRATADRQP
jgi:O-antigen/teichoic acid export membrane protein